MKKQFFAGALIVAIGFMVIVPAPNFVHASTSIAVRPVSSESSEKCESTTKLTRAEIKAKISENEKNLREQIKSAKSEQITVVAEARAAAKLATKTALQDFKAKLFAAETKDEKMAAYLSYKETVAQIKADLKSALESSKDSLDTTKESAKQQRTANLKYLKERLKSNNRIGVNPCVKGASTTDIRACVKSAKAVSKAAIKDAKQEILELKRAKADRVVIQQARKNLNTVTKTARKAEKLARQACRSLSQN